MDSTRRFPGATPSASRAAHDPIAGQAARSVPVARPPTILEAILECQRTPVVISLVLLPVVSWVWIVVMALDMYGPMDGSSAWMMTAVWDTPHLSVGGIWMLVRP
jgi:hypothetical protein